jgi:hypothetical protein
MLHRDPSRACVSFDSPVSGRFTCNTAKDAPIEIPPAKKAFPRERLSSRDDVSSLATQAARAISTAHSSWSDDRVRANSPNDFSR